MRMTSSDRLISFVRIGQTVCRLTVNSRHHFVCLQRKDETKLHHRFSTFLIITSTGIENGSAIDNDKFFPLNKSKKSKTKWVTDYVNPFQKQLWIVQLSVVSPST